MLTNLLLQILDPCFLSIGDWAQYIGSCRDASLDHIWKTIHGAQRKPAKGVSVGVWRIVCRDSVVVA
jgi:hypothetical protein